LGFRQIGLCTLAWLAATRPAIAVDPKQTAADYLRQTFTTDDGLPSNIVNDVLQMRDGFLIVGASNGVFRFDGHRFAEMNSDPPKEIHVSSLAEGLTATSGLQPGSAFTGLHAQRSVSEGRLYRCIT
jgi:ligand-binding sensor domain-containing protein